jgi:hypothetical protein
MAGTLPGFLRTVPYMTQWLCGSCFYVVCMLTHYSADGILYILVVWNSLTIFFLKTLQVAEVKFSFSLKPRMTHRKENQTSEKRS